MLILPIRPMILPLAWLMVAATGPIPTQAQAQSPAPAPVLEPAQTPAVSDPAPESLAANAALYYWQAFSILPETDVSDPAESELGQLTEWIGNWEEVELTDARLEIIAASTLDAVMLRLDDARPLSCEWGLNFTREGPATLLPQLGQARYASRFAFLRARIALETQDDRFIRSGLSPAESTVTDVASILALGRNTAKPDLLISGLVQASIEMAAIRFLTNHWGDLDDAALELLAQHLDDLPDFSSLAQGIQGEKDGFHGWLEQQLDAAAPDLNGQLAALNPMLGRIQRNRMAEMVDGMGELYDEIIAAAALPLNERIDACNEIEARMPDHENILARLMIPAFSAAGRSFGEVEIKQAMLLSMIHERLGREPVLDPWTLEPFARVEENSTVTLTSPFTDRQSEPVSMTFVGAAE